MNQEQISECILKTTRNLLRPIEDMTLFAAEALVKKVKKKATEMGVNAVVAITNRGSNLILLEAMDDSYIASVDIAIKKAYTVVALKMSTKELSSLANPNGSLYGIQFTNNNKICIFGGGDTLTNEKGCIIGGVGVSGGSEEQDTLLSKYAKEVFESL